MLQVKGEIFVFKYCAPMQHHSLFKNLSLLSWNMFDCYSEISSEDETKLSGTCMNTVQCVLSVVNHV